MRFTTSFRTKTLAAAAGVLVAGAALAAPNDATPPTSMTPPAFEKIDKNQDGKVSETEAQGSWLAGHFANVDTNHDGSVSRDEYQKATS